MNNWVFLMLKNRSAILQRKTLVISAILVLSMLLDYQSNFVFAQENSISETIFTKPVATEIINSLQPTASVSQQLKIDNSFAELKSALIKKSVFVKKLVKKDYRADEEVDFVIENASDTNLAINVVDYEGNTTEIKPEVVTHDNYQLVTIKPSQKLKPGKYKIIITEEGGNTFEQDFTWGVLALNTNKAVYRPSEKVNFSIAVLDERGEIVCDADVNIAYYSAGWPNSRRALNQKWKNTS